MTYIDPKNLDRLPPEQRKQFEELLKAYPHVNMKSKMQTARELNTPVAQEMKRKEESKRPSIQTSVANPVPEDSLDFSNIEQQQEEQRNYAPRAPVLGKMSVDPEQTNYRSIREEENEDTRFQRRDPPGPPNQPPPPPRGPQQPKKSGKFSPVGKRHPVMERMRASLGLDQLEKPVAVTVAGVEYEMHRLVRQDIHKASALASLRSQDEINLKSNVEAALVAYSVRRIDRVAVEDVFEIPYREPSYKTGRDEDLTPVERRDKGHKLFFEFLIDSPTELTEALVTYYEQNFQTLALVSKDNVLALCPEANCGYKALIDKQDKRFCPFHGSELKKETDLPNPS